MFTYYLLNHNCMSAMLQLTDRLSFLHFFSVDRLYLVERLFLSVSKENVLSNCSCSRKETKQAKKLRLVTFYSVIKQTTKLSCWKVHTFESSIRRLLYHDSVCIVLSRTHNLQTKSPVSYNNSIENYSWNHKMKLSSCIHSI